MVKIIVFPNVSKNAVVYVQVVSQENVLIISDMNCKVAFSTSSDCALVQTDNDHVVIVFFDAFRNVPMSILIFSGTALCSKQKDFCFVPIKLMQFIFGIVANPHYHYGRAVRYFVLPNLCSWQKRKVPLIATNRYPIKVDILIRVVDSTIFRL